MKTGTSIYDHIKRGIVYKVEDYLAGLDQSQLAYFLSGDLATSLPPLHIALLNGHMTIAQKLIDCGANCNQISANVEALSPIHAAAMQTLPELIDLLVSQEDIQLDVKTNQGDSALDIAIYLAIQENSSRYNAVISALIQAGVKPNFYDSEKLLPLLLIAAANDDVDFLKTMRHWLAQIWPTEGPKLFHKSTAEQGNNLLLTQAVQNLAPNAIRYLLDECDVPLYCHPSKGDGVFFVYGKTLAPERQNYLHYLANAMPATELFFLPALLEQKKLLTKSNFDKDVIKELMASLGVYGETRVWAPQYGDTLQLKAFACESGIMLEYNESGAIKDADKLLERLDQCLALLVERGLDINQITSVKKRPAQALLTCPVEVIDYFVKHGVVFTTEDLHDAILLHHPEVALRLIQLGVSTDEKVNGKTALECFQSALSSNTKLYGKEKMLVGVLNQNSSDSTLDTETIPMHVRI